MDPHAEDYSGAPTGAPLVDRVSVFLCAPTGTDLDVLPEMRAILDTGIIRSVSNLHPCGSLQELHKTLLQSKPAVLHYGGHGNARLEKDRIAYRTLAFTQANGSADMVEPRALVDMLVTAAHHRTHPLLCVVLNACTTFELGWELHRAGVPFVVCWRTIVENAACTAFSSGFYHALATGSGFADAYIAGCDRMKAARCTIGDPEAHMVVTDLAQGGAPVVYADGSPLRRNPSGGSGVLPFSRLVHGIPALLPEEAVRADHPTVRDTDRARAHSLYTKRIWASAGMTGVFAAASAAGQLNAAFLSERLADHPALVQSVAPELRLAMDRAAATGGVAGVVSSVAASAEGAASTAPPPVSLVSTIPGRVSSSNDAASSDTTSLSGSTSTRTGREPMGPPLSPAPPTAEVPEALRPVPTAPTAFVATTAAKVGAFPTGPLTAVDVTQLAAPNLTPLELGRRPPQPGASLARLLSRPLLSVHGGGGGARLAPAVALSPMSDVGMDTGASVRSRQTAVGGSASRVLSPGTATTTPSLAFSPRSVLTGNRGACSGGDGETADGCSDAAGSEAGSGAMDERSSESSSGEAAAVAAARLAKGGGAADGGMEVEGALVALPVDAALDAEVHGIWAGVGGGGDVSGLVVGGRKAVRGVDDSATSARAIKRARPRQLVGASASTTEQQQVADVTDAEHEEETVAVSASFRRMSLGNVTALPLPVRNGRGRGGEGDGVALGDDDAEEGAAPTAREAGLEKGGAHQTPVAGAVPPPLSNALGVALLRTLQAALAAYDEPGEGGCEEEMEVEDDALPSADRSGEGRAKASPTSTGSSSRSAMHSASSPSPQSVHTGPSRSTTPLSPLSLARAAPTQQQPSPVMHSHGVDGAPRVNKAGAPSVSLPAHPSSPAPGARGKTRVLIAVGGRGGGGPDTLELCALGPTGTADPSSATALQWVRTKLVWDAVDFATAASPHGLYLLGGKSEGGPTARVALLQPLLKREEGSAAHGTLSRSVRLLDLPDMEVPRSQAGGAFLSALDVVCVTGGWAGGQGRHPESTLKRVDALDTKAGVWVEWPSMVFERSRHAVVPSLSGQVLYAVGGEEPSTGRVLSTVEFYDPRTSGWQLLPSLVNERCSLGAAFDSYGRLYAVGGDRGGGQGCRSVERLDMRAVSVRKGALRAPPSIVSLGTSAVALESASSSGSGKGEPRSTWGWDRVADMTHKRRGHGVCSSIPANGSSSASAPGSLLATLLAPAQGPAPTPMAPSTPPSGGESGTAAPDAPPPSSSSEVVFAYGGLSRGWGNKRHGEMFCLRSGLWRAAPEMHAERALLALACYDVEL